MVEKLFIERLQEIVDRFGDHPALMVDGITTHTYRTLWKQSAQIAARLQQMGVEREDVVGIHLPRSPAFIISLIGIWRAGAAYLPLVPSWPASRRQFMLEDASVRVLITDSDGPAGESWSGPKLIFGDNPPTFPTFHPPAIAARDLAYIIYTSGTTGQPKGVAVEQRGLVPLLDAQINAFRLRPGSRVLFLLSTAFDASISDIGTALLSGAVLGLESEDSQRGAERAGVTPETLLRVLQQRDITHVDLPPSVLSLLDATADLPALETIVIGGEACRQEAVRAWARRCRVVNVYGPTEATVCTSLCVCDAATWDRALIGQPLDGVSYRLLPRESSSDTDLEPLYGTLEQTGELLISGRCLARGYVNDPEATAARFVRINGETWYRTGDLIRHDPDGKFVFLGRVDRQIKLRGHRIEPEEIEAILAAQPGVHRSAVIARPVSPGAERRMLIAFVAVSSPRHDQHVRADVLRSRLSKSLPPWMIPQRIELLEALPLTASGKVNLAMLATMSLAEEAAEKPPLAGNAQLLRDLWRDVLGVTCGLDDNFFEQGGDSLAVLEVIALSAARGLHLSPAMFAAPTTIRSMRACLERDEAMPSGTVAMAADELRRDVATFSEPIRMLAALQQSGRVVSDQRTADQILLTGATGFLGCRVLETLLRRTERGIVCLIRANNDEAARTRLQDTVRRQRLDINVKDFSRLEVRAADIDQESCGLSDSYWERLCLSVADVFHCAARINLLDTYAALRQTNVGGVAELLRLCAIGRPKEFHYASTLSVFVGGEPCCGRLSEEDDLIGTHTVYGGYAQSKWGAEAMLRQLPEMADRCCVFRFGLLAIDLRSVIVPQDDILTLSMRGLVELGCLPENVPDLFIDLTPVDYAARAMVHLALRSEGLQSEPRRSYRTFHLANPPSVSLRRLLACLEKLRPDLKRVSPTEFLERIEQHRNSREAAACLGLCRWLLPEELWPQYRPFDICQATGVEFETCQTSQGLMDSGIRPPASDDSLITTILKRILAE